MNIIHKIMDVQMSILECKTGATDLKILDTVIGRIKQLEADKLESYKFIKDITEQFNIAEYCNATEFLENIEQYINGVEK